MSVHNSKSNLEMFNTQNPVGTDLNIDRMDLRVETLLVDGTTSFQAQVNTGDIVATGTITADVVSVGSGVVTVDIFGVATTGIIKSSGSTSGIGYGTGAGGTETQAASKTTPVTISPVTMNGAITMNAASLASGATASFTVSNPAIAATDHILVNLRSGAAGNGTYRVQVDAVASTSCVISVTNLSGVALAEALVIGWAIIKGVNA